MNSSRARTSIPVEFQAGDSRGTGKISNMGAGGLFIGTGTIPEQGEPVSLCFTPPGESPIALTGLVWWTTKGGLQPAGAPQGFGLRLLDASDAYERTVERLLS